jgi:type II secretory pathway pseudopilin PulG
VAAFSVIEIVFALGVAATMAGAAIPQLLASLDDVRVVAAARYVSAELQRTRMDAVRRNASCALRFVQSGDTYWFTAFVDGNRNGVLTRDITSGTDVPIGVARSLSSLFSGIEFGTIAGLPGVDADSVAPGADPIRLGAGDMAVFTADGTATAGTLYIRSARQRQYAVRVFGETGRTRVLAFDPRRFMWVALGP